MSTPTTTTPGTTPEIDLEPGARVGEYEIEGKLGQGAFGTVFKAVHPLIGKQVAIKVLARRFSVDPEMVSRFVAEARAVNQIRHRHIIDIFSFGALEDGRQYYVMEHLDGEPLDALIDREHRIPLADALSILRAIGKALDAAHGKGVAHRDLKAENVFLGRDVDGGGVATYWPKLLDFGIAKLMSPEDGLKHKTRTGAPIGTPYYMSPEQCRGIDVDHRTDLYAFGVLTYLMLTGVYPHDADDYMSILMKQLQDQPAPPSVHAGELTPEIDEVVLWLMHKDPAQRPPDLRTAVRALEQAAASAGLVAPPTSSWDAQTGPVSRPFATQTAPIGVARSSGMGSSGMGSSLGSGGLPSPAAPRPTARSRTPVIASLAAGAVIAAGVVLFVARGGKDERPAPAAPRAPIAEPAPPPAIMPTPAVVAPPVDAVLPQTVIVSVTGVPEGTEVFVGGMTVGAAPGPVQLPRDTARVLLTFKADGYLTTSREVVPDRDQPLAVALKKRGGGGGGGRPPTRRDDLLDPFKRKP